MSEENQLTSQADELPPASQKTKEQWLDEGNLLSFYAPFRREEGLAAYEQAIRIEPRHALNYVSKGWLLERLARYEDALAAYQEASRLEPNDAGIRRSIGDVLTTL